MVECWTVVQEMRGLKVRIPEPAVFLHLPINVAANMYVQYPQLNSHILVAKIVVFGFWMFSYGLPFRCGLDFMVSFTLLLVRRRGIKPVLRW